MGYKNILLGVVSSSLFALLSHKLTKRYERNNACKLFNEQEDRFLMLKESLNNEIKFKTDTNKEQVMQQCKILKIKNYVEELHFYLKKYIILTKLI